MSWESDITLQTTLKWSNHSHVQRPNGSLQLCDALVRWNKSSVSNLLHLIGFVCSVQIHWKGVIRCIFILIVASFFSFFSKASYDSWVHSVRHLFFPLTSDGTFKRFHAIHQSQQCTINDAPFPIAGRREMKGGYGLHFESETLMRCEHWTCKNIHVHSLWEREHRRAAREASASSAQWSLLSQTQHLTMFIPPAPSPQHTCPFSSTALLIIQPATQDTTATPVGCVAFLCVPEAAPEVPPTRPRAATRKTIIFSFFLPWDSCVYDHRRPKSLTATKIQLTARLHLRGCKAAVLGRYHETHSHYTSQNSQYTSTDVPAWVTVSFFFGGWRIKFYLLVAVGAIKTLKLPSRPPKITTSDNLRAFCGKALDFDQKSRDELFCRTC